MARTLLTLITLAAPLVASRAPQAPDPEAVAARADATTISFAELDQLLLDRQAMSEEGRAVLRHLVRLRTLESFAEERAVEVSAAAVEARWRELDEQLEQAGRGGIASMLSQGRLAPDELREYLRLSIVQETLTRRAVGLGDEAQVSGEQQELWLDTQLRERRAEELVPPWPAPSSPVARVGELAIRRDDYAATLRKRLPEEDVREGCYHLLLEKRMLARMPDLAPEALARAVADELARKRAEAENDPATKDLGYEMLLRARGMTEQSLARDPTTRVLALSRLWMERAWDDAALRRAYQDERDWFDGQFGEALEISTVFLRGARFRNDMNPRSFEQAEEQLALLARGIRSQEDLRTAAMEHSEDPGSRERGGTLGWVTRGESGVPEEVRRAAFECARLLDEDPTVSRLVGPVRTPGGALLLWIGQRRAAPGWEGMRQAVRIELRRRFLDECLRPSAVVTWMDLG